MKTVCYTDLTEKSLPAATIAAEFASLTKDTLHLIYPAAGPVDRLRARLSHQAEAHTFLQEQMDRLAARGIPVVAAQHAEPLSRHIANLTMPSETRLTVVAATAARAPNLMLHVSTAEMIAEHSQVPTLVVRKGASLLSWLQRRENLKVICAYDFSASGNAALGYVRQLRALGSCDIVVAHVGRLAEERARLGITTPMCLDGEESAVKHSLEREIRERTDALLGAESPVGIYVKGVWGRPDLDLLNLAGNLENGLLIIGSHQWHGIQRLLHLSVSRFVLRSVCENVLVVPHHAGPVPMPQNESRENMVRA